MKLAEEVVFPFLDESARLIKKQLENLAQFQPMDTIKIEQATPSPAVAQIKAPTPDKPKEGWTSWTLRMLRIY